MFAGAKALHLILLPLLLALSCNQVPQDASGSKQRGGVTTEEEAESTTEASTVLTAEEAGEVATTEAKVTLKKGSSAFAMKVSIVQTSAPKAAKDLTLASKAQAIKITDSQGTRLKKISLPLEVSLKDLTTSGKDIWILIVEADGKISLIQHPNLSGSSATFLISSTEFTAVAIQAQSTIPAGIDFFIDAQGIRKPVSSSGTTTESSDTTTSTTDATTTPTAASDTTPPTLSLSSPSAAITTTTSITYMLTYSGADAVTLVNSDVTLNTTGTAAATVTVSGTGTATRTVTISAITGNGTLGITIGAGTAHDHAGNMAAASGASTAFLVDNTAPLTPSLSSTSGNFGGSLSVTVSQNATTDTYFQEFRYTTTGTAPSSCSDGTASASGSLSFNTTSSITLKVIACDTAGNKSSAVTGTYTYVAPPNTSLSFDGTDDYATYGNTGMNITGDITVAAWVKTPSSWPGSQSFPQIVSRGDSGITGWNLFLHRPDQTPKFSFIVLAGGAWGDDQTLDIDVAQTSTWYYVVGVREGTNIKLYVNGALKATDTGTSGAINYGSGTINNFIGKKTSSTAVDHWKGNIDGVRIYAKALSAAEITTLYNQGSGTNSNNDGSGNAISDLKLKLDCDDGTGTALADSSGSSNSGVTYGPTWSSENSSSDPYFSSTSLLLHMDGSHNSTTFTDEKGLTITPDSGYVISTAQKKFGSASGYFPGSTPGALSLPSSSSLTLSGDFTIEFWMYVTTTNPMVVLLGSNFGGGGGNYQLQFNHDGSGKIGLYNNSGWCESPNVSISASTWHYMTFARSGSTLRMYQNGTQLGSDISCGGTFDFSQGAIGALRGYNSQMFAGYLDDFRITKGTARYTGSSFTLPTTALPNN